MRSVVTRKPDTKRTSSQMVSVTIYDVLSWGPCSRYNRDVLTEIFGRKKKLTAIDILGLKKVPAADRIWAIARDVFLDDCSLRLYAADCAEHVLKFFEEERPEDKRPREAIEAARKFARGEIDIATLNAAWDAGAAWAAAWAARAAVGAALAARAAAWGAWAAGAARAAEQKWQLSRLRWYLTKHGR